jgi:hypothetical protein
MTTKQDDDNNDNVLQDLIFGPGYCKSCGLIKPLAMVAVPGLHEDEETGELDGGTLYFDPLDERRQGYCYECAPLILDKIKNKDA